MEPKKYFQVAAICSYGSSENNKPIAFFDQMQLASDYKAKLTRVLSLIYPPFPILPFPFSREDIQFLNKKFPEANWEDLFYCEEIDKIIIIECEETDIKI